MEKDICRSNSIDSVAGMLIIYMVVTHCFQWASLIESSIYRGSLKFMGFFMAWFFFKGGMFFKPKGLRVTLQTGMNRLLVPYLFWSLVGIIVAFVYLCLHSDLDLIFFLKKNIKGIVFWGSVESNLPLWFLLTLFFVRLLFDSSCQLLKNTFPVFPLSICLSLGFFLLDFNIPYYFENVFLGLAFFSLGYSLGTLRLKLSLMPVIVLFLTQSFFFEPYVSFRSNSSESFLNYVVWLEWSVLGIIIINTVFLWLGSKKNRLVRFFVEILGFLGKNSMLFYCSHWIVLVVTQKFILKVVEFNELQVYLVMEILLFAICSLWIRRKQLEPIK